MPEHDAPELTPDEAAALMVGATNPHSEAEEKRASDAAILAADVADRRTLDAPVCEAIVETLQAIDLAHRGAPFRPLSTAQRNGAVRTVARMLPWPEADEYRPRSLSTEPHDTNASLVEHVAGCELPPGLTAALHHLTGQTFRAAMVYTLSAARQASLIDRTTGRVPFAHTWTRTDPDTGRSASLWTGQARFFHTWDECSQAFDAVTAAAWRLRTATDETDARQADAWASFDPMGVEIPADAVAQISPGSIRAVRAALGTFGATGNVVRSRRSK